MPNTSIVARVRALLVYSPSSKMATQEARSDCVIAMLLKYPEYRYPHFIDPATGMQRKTHPFDRGAVANIRMFFHLTAADEAMCLQCDEPEAEMAA